ncbi:MAG: DNA mismatch endonuclease Vsr [Pseudomonadota bacterium]
MTDVFAPSQRSRIMARVKGKNTRPEIRVRSLLHRLGYRFRLHRKDLPGTPDIVLPGRRTVVFVHGCFWHQHPGCKQATRPVANAAYWNEKLDRNMARDARHIHALGALGWKTIIVWECELKDIAALERRLIEELGVRLASGV